MLAALETPVVLVEHSRLMENIRWARELSRQHGVALRPHVKTHKCLEIARLQMEEGAVGITASKTDEALAFITAGVPSVTVAYPIVDQAKAARLLGAAREHGTDLRVVVDGEEGLACLSRAAARTDMPIGVYIEVDVGLRRCGLKEEDPRLMQLAERVRASSSVRLHGLLSHAGHAYGARDAEEVRAIAAEECAILGRVRRRLERAGIPVPEVSVGSTPTVLASESYEGITEIRPGNYVFMDRTPVRLGLVGVERVALTVLATVVSANEGFFIIDAGSKVLSSDLGAHGTGGGTGFGLAFAAERPLGSGAVLEIEKLSEEHGFVKRGGADLAVGSRLRVIPNHACPVVNLADELVVVNGEITRWPVMARGRVR